MNGNRKNIYLILGLIIIFYGLSFPASVYDWTGNLYEMIEDSILYSDAGLLLKASFFYITWNVFTFMMIYSGSMLMAMAVSTDKNSPYYQLSFALIVLLNVFIYNMIYSEHESFLLHMVISAAFLLLQLFIPKQPFSVLPQLIILFLILVSFSWLDLSPGLTRADLGSDDFAASLKVADSYLSEYKILNNLSLSFFFVFSILSLIFTVLIYLFSKQILTIKKVQKQEKELKETRDALLETNVYKEIHTLVHDLKTPLVTVEGLISLLELKVTQDEKASTYFNKINAATAKMKEMISEILSEDIKQEIGVEDFIGYVTSHISFDHVQIDFNLTIDEHVSPIKVNKIRFARALSNVIENAMLSLGDQKGYIHLEVEGIDNGVLFRVEDNGPGIEKRNMNKIWEEGFSTKNSSGVGMPFVKQVVENHQGAIRVSSIPNEKTTVEIFLPY